MSPGTRWVDLRARLVPDEAAEAALAESRKALNAMMERWPARVVANEVIEERGRQDDKWGEQNHLDGILRPGDIAAYEEAQRRCKSNTPATDNWRDILDEEVTEAYVSTSQTELRAELVQIAAVAVAWIEHIDRRLAAHVCGTLGCGCTLDP